jgi:hypothetical protein
MAKNQFVSYVRRSLAGFLAFAATAAVMADDTEGVVRIRSDAAPEHPAVVVRGQSPDSQVTPTGLFHHHSDCPENCPPSDCPDSSCGLCSHGNCFSHCLRMQCAHRRLRNQIASDQLHAMIEQDCDDKCAWFRYKFGYFFPSGCCGKGCPPTGHYSMVYPLNPNYSDARDAQVYAAQGYAGPVSVPLAPVVHHAYNYGWGIPSSRLTPISNPIGY